MRRAVRLACLTVCLLAAAGCTATAPRHSPSRAGAAASAVQPAASRPVTAHRHFLAAAYLAIARPANRRLDAAENAYSAHCRSDLAAAEAALRAEAATERWFDRRLAMIAVPTAIATTAVALIRINQIRIAFTLRQARARSVRALLAFSGGHRSADAQLEAQVRVIRAELGLPPPRSS